MALWHHCTYSHSIPSTQRKPIMTTFIVGRTYQTRSIGDHDCIISVTIASRTAKTVKTTDGKSFRLSTYYRDNLEMFMPWGRYSTAPIITAGD